MTPDELLNLHENTCDHCREIMKSKNTDYCGGSGDPFANFRISEILGIPPELGILMRMTDKMQRVRSFLANGTLAVKSESYKDACDDLVNYAILLKGMLIERAGAPNTVDTMDPKEVGHHRKVYQALTESKHALNSESSLSPVGVDGEPGLGGTAG